MKNDCQNARAQRLVPAGGFFVLFFISLFGSSNVPRRIAAFRLRLTRRRSVLGRRVLSRRALRKRARRFEKVLFAPHGTFRLQRVELAHEGVHLLRLVPREPAGDVLRHGSTIEVKRSRLQVFRPGRQEVENRIRALRGRPKLPRHGRVKFRQRVRHPGRRHPPRMHGIIPHVSPSALHALLAHVL